MVVVCQLSLRSQGVPSWSANSKIASSYREKVNWARVVPAVRPFKRGMVRINRTQGRAAYCFLLQRLRGKEIHHKDKRARQQSWKSLSLSFRQHQHLFFFLSFSPFFPPCSHCGREDTDMDRALNSDAGKHFHFFLFKLFSFDFCFFVFLLLHPVSCMLCQWQSAGIFMDAKFTLSLGPTGNIMCL